MPHPIASSLRGRLGNVCAAVTGTTAGIMVENASAVLQQTSFLEFRLDGLDARELASPPAALAPLAQFLAGNAGVIAIATCRRAAHGGHFKGSLAAELAVLTQAAAAGFQIVDLELESAEAAKPPALLALRQAGAALLLSHHNYEATADLDGIYRRITAFAPDIVKVVSTAQTLADNITLLRFIERAADPSPLVGICMGDAGIVSRVLAVRAGGAFTFAAADAGRETAPGQVDARSLIETYRIDGIDGATKVYGVAGYPVRSSLSPLMQNTAFAREHVNAVYLPLPVSSVDDLLELVHELPLSGLSVTMPLKRDILPHLEKTDPLTARIGACNTVLRGAGGKLYGFNTDVAGITGPLEKRMPLRGAKVLVLGAGGAARAAVFGLKDKGAEVFILNRTPETARKLAKQAGAKVFKREAILNMKVDIVVNATSIGMAGEEAGAVLGPSELHALDPGLVFDLVYNPLETPLLALARQQAIPAVRGVEMFVHQGARQFEIWTGKPAPEEEMLRVVLQAL